MKEASTSILWVCFTFAWFAGMVLAKGFWSTVLAILFPPWALYLFVEKLVNTFLP